MSFQILLRGDCLSALRSMSEASIDAVVCDPPYELGFMGKSWDSAGIAFDPATWREALRVLKPGGYLLAFGGTRTYHRIAVAIEDAGFEIRDSLIWNYGSGFPKSLNVGNGRGTTLKPAFEPVVVARKPLIGTVAANVLAHGTGALNIDGCRVPTTDNLNGGAYSEGGRAALPGDVRTGAAAGMFAEGGGRLPGQFTQPEGRWPANLILSHGPDCNAEGCTPGCPCAALDAQSGGASRFFTVTEYGEDDDLPGAPFFYNAKASRSEREAGCGELPARSGAAAVDRAEGSAGLTPRAGAGRSATEVRNHHPTVKPVAVMRWLVRLVTPPGGVVLDPFLGSGTTGIAAVREGFNFIGVEREAEYIAIAEARIRHHGGNPEVA